MTLSLKDYSYVDSLPDLKVGCIGRVDNVFVLPYEPLQGRTLYSLRSHVIAPLVTVWELIDDDTEESVGLALSCEHGVEVSTSDTHLSVWSEAYKESSPKDELTVLEMTDNYSLFGVGYYATHLIIGEPDD